MLSSLSKAILPISPGVIKASHMQRIISYICVVWCRGGVRGERDEGEEGGTRGRGERGIRLRGRRENSQMRERRLIG
jgi:hypothetical protein